MNNNLYRETPYIPNQSNPYNNFMNGNQYNKLDYVENLLKENVSKKVRVFTSFADSVEWRDSVFNGTLKYAGKDFIVIHDDNNSKDYLLWSIYIDYILFNEDIII